MSRGTLRGRLEELTDTQRRVLELIAEGKTNYEIGQELGITLDGAKYHVGEILNKLGVDTREEAAATLGRERGRPGWLRTPAWKWLGVAGGAAAAAFAVLVVLGQLDGRDSDAHPAMRAAFLQVKGSDERHQQIVVVENDGSETLLGEPRRYGTVAWSPTGRHLMALELDPEPRVWIFDLESKDSVSWEVREFADFEWSPDGRHLAVLTREGDTVTVYDVGGAEVARYGGVGGGGLLLGSVGGRWSPDSSTFATLGEDSLVLVGLDGDSAAVALPDGTPRGEGVMLEWLDARTIQVFSTGGLAGLGRPSMWVRDVESGSASWEERDWEEPDSLLTPEVAERADSAAGEDMQRACVALTAERSGLVMAYVPEEGDRLRVTKYIVLIDDEFLVRDAPEGVSPVGLRGCVSVVLLG